MLKQMQGCIWQGCNQGKHWSPHNSWTVHRQAQWCQGHPYLHAAKAGVQLPLTCPRQANCPLPQTFLPCPAPTLSCAVTPAASSSTKPRVALPSRAGLASPSKGGFHMCSTSRSVSSDNLFASAHRDKDNLHEGEWSLMYCYCTWLTFPKQQWPLWLFPSIGLQVQSVRMCSQSSFSLNSLHWFWACLCLATTSSSSPSHLATVVRAATEGKLWKLLQAHAHTVNIDQFVCHFAHVLGHKFSATDAEYLWAHIKFPCL